MDRCPPDLSGSSELSKPSLFEPETSQNAHNTSDPEACAKQRALSYSTQHPPPKSKPAATIARRPWPETFPATEPDPPLTDLHAVGFHILTRFFTEGFLSGQWPCAFRRRLHAGVSTPTQCPSPNEDRTIAVSSNQFAASTRTPVGASMYLRED